MRVAVFVSRGVKLPDLAKYLPDGTTAIIAGGTQGVDASARQYVQQNGLELLEFLPDCRQHGRSAAFRRNEQMVEAADYVLAFWDGFSYGTAYVIKKCIALGKPYAMHILPK